MRGTTITFCAKLPVILNADPNAIKLDDHSFQKGSLSRISFVRPSKLFTANKELIFAEVDVLNKRKTNEIVHAVVSLLTS